MTTDEAPAPEGRKWIDVLLCVLSVLGGFCALVAAFVVGAGFAAYAQLAAARTGFLAVQTGPAPPDDEFNPFDLPPDDDDLPSDAPAEAGNVDVPGSGPEPAEPARMSYLWAEIWPAAGRTFSAYRDRMTDLPVRAVKYCWGILVTKQESLIYLPIAIGCVVGAVLSIPVAFTMALAGALVTAVAFVAGGAANGALWLLLAGADRALTTFRRVLVSCPHEAGCARFWHPVYECPAELCRRRHHRLVPNRFGLLRHTCECGTRLPTTVLLGRYRLNAYCPHCNGQLPGRIGAVRLAHLPFVGGPATGKSTLMHLVLDARRVAVEQAGGAFQFLDHWDERRLRDGLATLRSKRQLPATQNRLPSAVMVDVQPKTEAGHILYVFDPAGEVYDRMSSMHSQEYLRTSETQILVVDPFTIPDLRNALGATDLSAAAEVDPSLHSDAPRNSPDHLVDALVASLLPELPDTRSRPRIAVVVTKWDALRRTPLDVPADTAPDEVRRWLERWTTIVDTLEKAHLDVRCFASGLLETPAEQLNSIMDWCLGDLPPGRRRRPWLARLAGGVGRTPWKPRGSGPVPLSYRLWGGALVAGQALGIVGAGVLLANLVLAR